ncbi:unnamed protein product [Leuciscus chuanchicus]
MDSDMSEQQEKIHKRAQHKRSTCRPCLIPHETEPTALELRKGPGFVLKGFACWKNEQLHLLKSTTNMEHLVAHTWLRRFPLDLPECVAFVIEC